MPLNVSVIVDVPSFMFVKHNGFAISFVVQLTNESLVIHVPLLFLSKYHTTLLLSVNFHIFNRQFPVWVENTSARFRVGDTPNFVLNSCNVNQLLLLSLSEYWPFTKNLSLSLRLEKIL